MKAISFVLTAAMILASSPARAQSWETATLADGGIGALTTSNESADILLSCSDDEIPAVTIMLPQTDLPVDIAERLTLFVDGEDLDASWGFELNPAETGVWLRGDANAQWHNVRALAEKIAQGERLTVMVPSLGFATNFDLRGARRAMAPVMERCGLNR